MSFQRSFSPFDVNTFAEDSLYVPTSTSFPHTLDSTLSVGIALRLAVELPRKVFHLKRTLPATLAIIGLGIFTHGVAFAQDDTTSVTADATADSTANSTADTTAMSQGATTAADSTPAEKPTTANPPRRMHPPPPANPHLPRMKAPHHRHLLQRPNHRTAPSSKQTPRLLLRKRTRKTSSSQHSTPWMLRLANSYRTQSSM